MDIPSSERDGDAYSAGFGSARFSIRSNRKLCFPTFYLKMKEYPSFET
jgi:hypothetical protein